MINALHKITLHCSCGLRLCACAYGIRHTAYRRRQAIRLDRRFLVDPKLPQRGEKYQLQRKWSGGGRWRWRAGGGRPIGTYGEIIRSVPILHCYIQYVCLIKFHSNIIIMLVSALQNTTCSASIISGWMRCNSLTCVLEWIFVISQILGGGGGVVWEEGVFSAQCWDS